MEKIININYQNRNISIEENAYHVFQEYEKELTNYFNKEESGDEIMSDLQHRMAEILEEKLKSGAPAITLQDIEEIKSNIGQPTDFGNQESEEPIQEKVETEEPNFNKKKLYRNKFKNERILAGVCSGLANYFAIDPIAVRIVFVLVTLLNLGTFFSFNLGILAYIILWATVPQQYMKPNVQQKLFRNPKDKVIAGVCSGLAQFFNIETWILRSIFLLPILIGIFSHNAPFRFHFLGSSLSSIMLVIYIVLWVITPIAKSATDYMLLKGEPINLSTIQNPISMQTISQDAKSSLNSFFKIVAYILIFFALMVLIPTSFGAMVAALFSINITKVVLFTPTMQTLGLLSIILLFSLPLLGLIIWTIRRINGYKKPNTYLRMLFTSLWLIGIGSGVIVAFNLIKDMNTLVGNKTKIQLTSALDTIYVKPMDTSNVTEENVIFDVNKFNNMVNINSNNVEIKSIKFKHKPSETGEPYILVEKFAFGSNKEKANENNEAYVFQPQIIDNTIYLPTHITFPKNKPYRFQHVKVTIFLPSTKTLVVNKDLKNQLRYRFNVGHKGFYYSSHDRTDEDEIVSYDNTRITIDDDNKTDKVIRMNDDQKAAIEEAKRDLEESQREAKLQIEEAQRNLEQSKRETELQIEEAKRNLERSKQETDRQIEEAKRNLNK